MQTLRTPKTLLYAAAHEVFTSEPFAAPPFGRKLAISEVILSKSLRALKKVNHATKPSQAKKPACCLRVSRRIGTNW
jgi:hypothetical protein